MFLVAQTSDEALLSHFSSWLCLSSELRSLDDELDKLLSSLELRWLDEELDKDDEDEDSFENLEEWSSIEHYTNIGIHNDYTLAITVIGTIRYYRTEYNRKQ
jgi:hypothetical protein